MLARLVQLSNAAGPMRVTLEGMVMAVSLVQPQNASMPMLETLEGIA